jgi:maltose/moltooligosaccharide transporter
MTRRPHIAWLVAFAAAASGAGLGRAVTTSYLPVLLERIRDAPGLIGVVMLVNAVAGFAVPLAVGIWSDRRRAHGRRAARPLILGGAAFTAGGLIAIAAGATSSYLALAAFAFVAYVGLNTVTTSHRTLVRQSFEPSVWAKTTSAQELALLAGGLVGVAVGGWLLEVDLRAPFFVAAVAVVLLALPTLRVAEDGGAGPQEMERRPPLAYLKQIAIRPGVRSFLAAQILWVLGYAALPTFFVLYAENVLGLSPSAASLWLAGFGIATAVAVVAGGRVRKAQLHRQLLMAAVAAMGLGFAAVGMADSVAAAGPALLLAGIGFGVISTLGYPLYSSLIPAAEAGAYTALFFAARAIASAIALPLAGLAVAVGGSYRALFVVATAATLLALIPLAFVGRESARALRPRWLGRWLGSAAATWSVVLVAGLLVYATPLERLDHQLFRAINGFGYGPDVLWRTLNPHTQNYAFLVALGVGLALVTVPRRAAAVAGLTLGSALLAWTLLEAVYAVFDRPRPEEELGAVVNLEGNSWGHLESYPSGHMAITVALAAALALSFPRLRFALAAYVVAVGFTRVLFGAHFPSDVLAGTALGVSSALLVARLPLGRRAPVRSLSRTDTQRWWRSTIGPRMKGSRLRPAPALVGFRVRGRLARRSGSLPAFEQAAPSDSPRGSSA